MVNVTHNTDNRRTLHHICFILFVFFQKFFDHIDNYFFLTKNIEFHCDFFCCLIINFLVYCYNLALHKQLFNNYRWNNLHLISKFLDCKNFRNCNLFNFFFHLNRLRLWFLRFFHFSYLFLLFTFFAFILKLSVTKLFLLVIFLFVFCFISLSFLLFYHWCRNRITIFSASLSLSSLWT